FITQAEIESKVRLHLPTVIDIIGLLETVRIDDRAAKDFGSKAALDAGKLVNEVAEGRETATRREGQSAAIVKRHKLFRKLARQVGADAEGVRTLRPGDGILILEVIEDAPLREQIRQPDATNLCAAEGKGRSEVNRRLIARREESLKPPVREAE